MTADVTLGAPDITWRQTSSRTDRIIGKGASYVIENAQLDDAGIYMIFANTILDEDSEMVEVVVQGICTFTNTHMHTHAHTRARTHAHTHTHTHTRARARASLEYPIRFIFYVIMSGLRAD